GIGDYYEKYAAHTIFDEFIPEELGIDIRLFQEVFYCTRCDQPASNQTCPHDEEYRINISGTGIRELLRYGVLPPKEIVRPESARIAMQGIQPKGVDENNQAINPVGKTIKSILPYYLHHSRIGGPERKEPLTVEELTIEDLSEAIRDVRLNADRVYREIFEEFSYVTDTLRTAQDDWVTEARDQMYKQQKMVVDSLKEKVSNAPDETSDEFMYQDKKEAERELVVAQKIINDIPKALNNENMNYRTWNTLPYERYRGSDEE